MSPDNLRRFRDVIAKPYGLVLCVGPTGSGKTTTLHSALGAINTEDVKIWTAEDPVEITQAGLRQVQVRPKIGFDFAAAMRSFLRADPDVIMVGEMRDLETAGTGIEASLTGHLVFSTLHTNSAPETVTRLLDIGLDPFNFADALLGVLAQRLVRTLCKSCKEAYHPEELELRALREAYAVDGARGGELAFTPDAITLSSRCVTAQSRGTTWPPGRRRHGCGRVPIRAALQSRATASGCWRRTTEAWRSSTASCSRSAATLPPASTAR